MREEFTKKKVLAKVFAPSYMRIMDTSFLPDLDSLDAAQLAELEAQIALRRQSTADRNGTVRDDRNEFWQALLDVLPSGKNPSLKAFLVNYGASKFDDRVAHLTNYLDTTLPRFVRKPVRMSVREHVLRSLTDYLTACRIPVTATTMLNNFDKLAYSVDRNFPGYAEAKLLHRLVNIAA